MSVLLILSCALLLFGRAEAYVFDDARTKTMEFVTPLLDWMSTPVTLFRDWLGNFDDYFDVYEKNRLLRAENTRLKAWKTRALQLEQVTARYKDLLDVQLEPDITYISGRVVSDSGGPFVHTLIINTGRKQGVNEGQAVVDSQGFIGRVVGTGAHAARILLISDLNSRVPVMIEPSQARAVMTGDNTSRPKLEFVSDNAALKTGDRVVTSGAGGMLPPALPIGLAVKMDDGNFRVQPFSDQARVSYVRVLQYEFPKEIAPSTDEAPAAAPNPAVTPLTTTPPPPAPPVSPAPVQTRNPIPPAPPSSAAPSAPPARPQISTGVPVEIRPLAEPDDTGGDEDG